jgi:hypothetical protein
LSHLARNVIAVGAALALLAPQKELCPAQQAPPVGPMEAHYQCDTDRVQLGGLLTARKYYGPPGFGKTPSEDAREDVLILKLARPITVEALADIQGNKRSCLANFPHLSSIQLFIFPETKLVSARKLIGKEVPVVGTLREGDAPSEHTKVTMDVKTLDPK